MLVKGEVVFGCFPLCAPKTQVDHQKCKVGGAHWRHARRINDGTVVEHLGLFHEERLD